MKFPFRRIVTALLIASAFAAGYYVGNVGAYYPAAIARSRADQNARHSDASEAPARLFIQPFSDESELLSRTGWKSADFFLHTDRPLANCDLRIWRILAPTKGKKELVLKFDHWAGWIFAEHRNTELGSLLSFRGSHSGQVVLGKTTGDIVVWPRASTTNLNMGGIALVVISLPDGMDKLPPELFSKIKEVLFNGHPDALSPIVEEFGVTLFAFEFSKSAAPVSENK